MPKIAYLTAFGVPHHAARRASAERCLGGIPKGGMNRRHKPERIPSWKILYHKREAFWYNFVHLRRLPRFYARRDEGTFLIRIIYALRIAGFERSDETIRRRFSFYNSHSVTIIP